MGSGVDGVLLAAGRSSRAGTFKMELELAGKPLLLWSLEAMAAVCSRVIVVAGYSPERIRRLTRGLPGTEVAVNENFAAGMLSSIQAGIRLVRARRFFISPGDMPLIGAAVYQKLLAVEAEIVVPLCRGRRGHPVLMAAGLVPELLSEPPASSLGRFIGRRPWQAVEVGDPGILADLDDLADSKEIGALLRAGGGK